MNIVSNKKLDLIRELANNKNNSFKKSNAKFNKKILAKNKLIIASIIFIILLCIIFLTSNPTNKHKADTTLKQSDAVIPMEIANTKLTSLSTNILSASGYVVPRRISTISAEITGKISEIYVEEGQKVSKGELIAKLDDTLAITAKNAAVAKLASMKSLVDSLQAKYRKAKFTADSKSELFKSGAVSKEIYIKSQTDAEGLIADIAKAKNDVKLAEIEIERQNKIVEQHSLLSPFNGVITSKDAYPGEIISPGSGSGGFTRTGIATVVDMTSLEVEVDVNESNINKVFAGQRVNIKLEAYSEKMFKGKVIAIIPSANKDKATIKVRIGFLEKEDIIFPNMAVKVDFLAKEYKE